MIGAGTIRDVREQVREQSAVAVCRDTLARIDAVNPALNAFLAVAAEAALARAAELDLRAACPPDAGPGDVRPSGAALHGVPIAIKDNICTRGVSTTAGSRMLASYVPPYAATVVERLEQAGAIVVGKTNCDEFAMGSSTENSAFGAARNPWALDRIPGGSSGGSAAAVASRTIAVALGSDTGGSVRQPAALCGVVGLKPTYGRVSRYGLLAFGSSLDQIGPLTLTVEDAALVLGTIAGHDPCDATSAREPVPDYTAALTGDVRSACLGVPWRMLDEGVDVDVANRFRAALDVLASRGATIVEIDLPNAAHAIPVYYLIATAEASSNLARYDGVRYGFRAACRESATAPRDQSRAGQDTDQRADALGAMYRRTRARGFGAEVKRRIMLGTYVLSAGYYDAYYLKAQQVRTLILRDYERAFQRVDVVAMPTSPTAAFTLGERAENPLQMYLADVFTVSANLAGLPAVSVPCGFSSGGLPVGLQLTGRPFDEATLLRIAEAYERDTGWWKSSPQLQIADCVIEEPRAESR